ncbi:MAG: hypothetical protein ACJ780_10765, partial [Solirubrobacteraceae bacterium]
MTPASRESIRGRVGPLSRLIVAVFAVVALVSGVLNVRPLFESVTGAGALAPAGPSPLETLVGAPQRPETALDAHIRDLQDALRSGNARAVGPAATMLGAAYLQKVRETGDPTYYPKAEGLFRQALAANDQDVDAIVGLGTLALARHQFADALQWGEQARALNPYHAPAYGVVADAQVELGRY